jgi:hypothetical protein
MNLQTTYSRAIPINNNQVGFILSALNNSQQAYETILCAHSLRVSGVETSIFKVDNGVPPIQVTCPVYDIVEATSFPGQLIATSLTTLQYLKNTFQQNKRWFMVWDLEWMFVPNYYRLVNKLYNDDNINIITRSQEHADAIKLTWQRSDGVYILENVNGESLRAILEG